MRVSRTLGAAVASAGFLIADSAGAAERGSEQVSHFYGSFSYSVPLQLPPFHGIEPRLALGYSSEGRNGQLGVGWSLTGISTIQTRTPAGHTCSTARS